MIPQCKTPGCNNDAALKEYRPDGTPKYRTICNTCRNEQRKQKQSLKPKPRVRKQTLRVTHSEPMPEETTERPKLDVDSGFIDARYEELRDRFHFFGALNTLNRVSETLTKSSRCLRRASTSVLLADFSSGRSKAVNCFSLK